MCTRHRKTQTTRCIAQRWLRKIWKKRGCCRLRWRESALGLARLQPWRLRWRESALGLARLQPWCQCNTDAERQEVAWQGHMCFYKPRLVQFKNQNVFKPCTWVCVFHAQQLYTHVKLYIHRRTHIICAVTQTLAWKASAEKGGIFPGNRSLAQTGFVLPEGARFTDVRACAISVNSYGEIRSASQRLVAEIHNTTSFKLHACR